jgi:hypothetical protein
MAEIFVNKVAESGIISIDLEDYYPKAPLKIFDLKEYLFMGLILKEKDFRAALLAFDWSVYDKANVGITCTADAIIPMWAFMLVASYLQPVANFVTIGNEQQLIEQLLQKNISEQITANNYVDQRVVIKGCGEIAIPEMAYVAVTNKLRPVVKSIMYGEPCSTVPIYKKKI